MKILFVCHRVPFPPKRGGKIRPFNIIQHWTKSGHEVTVASLARSPREADEAAGLRQHCARAIVEIIPDSVAWPRTLAWVPTRQPSSFAYFWSPKLARAVRDELATGTYDLAFVHCSSVAAYVGNVPRGVDGGALRMIDFGDMDSQKWREYVRSQPFPKSFVYWVEALKTEAAERRLAAQFDFCTATTRAELESLRSLGTTTPSDWFPNGVDATFFAPVPEYDANLVSFIGRMDYYPNQLAVQRFCADILPKLRAVRPEVRFEIVGADPPPFVRDLGKLPGVTVTGSVPDVRPYVTRAALTVAPLSIARGTQNKILESMALGVPVVCSVQASHGVDAIDGQHLIAASTDDEYVAAIRRIVESPDERRGFAERGRARVLSNHAWSSSLTRLDGLVAAAFERRARATGGGELSQSRA
jgi:sugar transferase (PEP-CTERM/EpsH1 system associated)